MWPLSCVAYGQSGLLMEPASQPARAWAHWGLQEKRNRGKLSLSLSLSLSFLFIAFAFSVCSSISELGCWFVLFRGWNQTSEWKVKSPLTLACVSVTIWRHFLHVPVGDAFLWGCMCVCVCMCLYLCVCPSTRYWFVREIFFSTEQISPPLPCFHSELVGDWWLNCGEHVNSKCWFIEILRVSEAVQTLRGKRKI